MNIRRNIFREIFIGIGILISVFVLILSVTFGDAIENMAKNNVFSRIPATRIKISGRIYSNPLNRFFNRRVHAQQNITWDFIKKNILSIKGVKSVIPIQNVTYPISAEFPFFGFNMKMDLIANGLPNGLAYPYIFPEFRRMLNWRFHQRGNVVPVLVSQFIIDAFRQMTISQNAPVTLDRDFFRPSAANGYRGYRFKMFLGKSQFGAVEDNFEEVEAVVVGFTDPDLTSGVSLPSDIVTRTKVKFQGPAIGYTFESAFIMIQDATYFDKVILALNALNRKYPHAFHLVLDREVQKFRDVSKMINETAKSFRIPILGFSIITLFLSCLIVFFSFLYLIRRREKEIGLYRFFGSSRLKIILLLVCEAILIAIICAYVGYELAKYVIVQYLPENFDKFVKILPKEVISILNTFSLGNKAAFQKLFVFSAEKGFTLCLYAVAASAVSAFIPSLIGSYRGLLKSVNQ